ncbi:hypothetical protein KVT40_004505 [Elsinoe batatas]|uniref:Uncharacterized protein n=1 Tax=Elsinoe batatas TaxID=2601811 RepID=A0A8K0L0V1_9PEZI|nr:hypothetical protein KVT40_004505 [Elsinoe batatas]
MSSTMQPKSRSQEYLDLYNQAEDLLESDGPRTLHLAKELLENNLLPLTIKMLTRILIAYATEDWDEGEHYRSEAEATYRISRRLWPEGATITSEVTEQNLKVARFRLDHLSKCQAEDSAAWANMDEDDEAEEHQVPALEEGRGKAAVEEQGFKSKWWPRRGRKG